MQFSPADVVAHITQPMMAAATVSSAGGMGSLDAETAEAWLRADAQLWNPGKVFE